MNTQFNLYFSNHCPYCAKVLIALQSMELEVNLIETNTAQALDMLKKGGGKTQVPCLNIVQGDQSTWMYESNDIIDFLKKQ